MRIKAFTLIEIIVALLLLGVIFSLVLSIYITKEEHQASDITKIAVSIKQPATLYIYGDECKKSILKIKDTMYINSPNFGYKEDNIVFKNNAVSQLIETPFETERIEGKNEHICFKLDFKDGKFFDKFIIKSANLYYLYLPFYQEVKTFKTFSAAKEAFNKEALYPKSLDDYYRE